MKHSSPRVGVAVRSGRAKHWQRLMVESLGEAGVAVDIRTTGAATGGAPCPEVPLPWAWPLAVQRFLARPRPDMFAAASLEAVPFEEAAVDALVLPPGAAASPELLSRLSLGVFEVEPIHPGRFGDGFLEGRMLWRRAGQAPRLAASTATCVEGPLPLAWAGPHLAKTARMPSRILARIKLAGEAFWDACPEAEPLPGFSPGIAAWLGFAAGLAGFGLKRAWQDIFHRRQWFLAMRDGNADPLRPGFSSTAFKPVLPPRGTGWADPVLFARDGRTWLFVEEIPGQGKGVLSVMELFPGGGLGQPRRVLEEPFHLSYPRVFEHGGEVYMIPETAQARQVRLYRATDFPGGWVLDRVLLDHAPATDATFLEHQGTWWMFVNIRPEGGSSWDELHLFRGESRLGPFHPHPLNPVVSDVRRARPGGPFIRRGDRLFRPAQDCSGWYGRALAVMEVTRLDERGYQEREAARLSPELIPGSFCLHTLETKGALEVVDGQRRVPLWG